MRCIVRAVDWGSREADLLPNREILLTPSHAMLALRKWVKVKGGVGWIRAVGCRDLYVTLEVVAHAVFHLWGGFGGAGEHIHSSRVASPYHSEHSELAAMQP